MAVSNGNVAVLICSASINFNLETIKVCSTIIMKPIKPYVDYYITDPYTTDNCRSVSSGRSQLCRYVRMTGETCENLDTTYTYSNSDFSNYIPTISNNLGSDPFVVSTNCSQIDTNNYNPGTENIILNNTALFLSLLIIIFIGVMAWCVIKCLPRLSSRR